MNSRLYDSHVHTELSPDSSSDPKESCRTAVDLGISGICFTDHAEFAPGEFIPQEAEVYAMRSRLETLQQDYGGDLEINQGTEIGYHAGRAADMIEFIDRHSFDFVLGAVHVVDGIQYSFSSSCKRMAQEGITARQFCRGYLNAVMGMVDEVPIDAVAHFDLPKRHGRYFTRNDRREVALEPGSQHWDLVCEILKKMVDNDVLLEVNASGIRQAPQQIYPSPAILRQYRKFGGRLVTFGSDSHTPDNVGFRFRQLAEQIGKMGLKQAWFRERRLISYQLVSTE